MTRDLGGRRDEAVEQKQKLEHRLAEIDGTVRNLLDNITAANRAFADVRLGELAAEKEGVEADLAEVGRLAVSDEQLRQTAGEAHRFLTGLSAVLSRDDLHVKHAAVRRCILAIELAADGRSASAASAYLESDQLPITTRQRRGCR